MTLQDSLEYQRLKAQLEAQEVIEKHRKKRSKQAAIPFIGFTTIAAAIMGTVGMAILFPVLPVWLLVLIFCSGLMVDGFVYTSSVRQSFKMIFGIGLLKDLEDHIIVRELEKNNLIKSLFHNESKSKTYFLLAWEIKKKNFINEQIKYYKKQGKTSWFAKRQAKKKWKVECISSDWVQSDDPLIQFGLAVEEIRNNTHRSEILIKKGLIIFSYAAAFANGIGFGVIAFTHVQAMLLGIGFMSALFGPFGIAVLAAVVATIAGFTWAKVVFKDMSKLIKEGKHFYIKIAKKIGFYHPKWSSLSSTEKKQHIVATVIRTLLAIGVLILGIMGVVLFAGSALDAMYTILKAIFGVIQPGIDVVAQIVVFGFLMVSDLVFAIRHGIGSVHKLVGYIEKGYQWFRNENTSWGDIWNQIKANPGKTIVFTIAGVITFVALIGHIIADAAYTAGEGAVADSSWPGKVFQFICSLLMVSPTILSVGGSSISEGIEHSDFVLKDGKKVSELSYSLLSKIFYHWPKDLFNFFRGKDVLTEKKMKEVMTEKPKGSTYAKFNKSINRVTEQRTTEALDLACMEKDKEEGLISVINRPILFQYPRHCEERSDEAIQEFGRLNQLDQSNSWIASSLRSSQ